MRILVCAIALCTAACLAFGEPAPTGNKQTYDVVMHDSIVLKTDVYLPSGDAQAYPSVLLRSPYPRAVIGKEAENWNKKGYAVVVQDVRGTGDSGGTFTGFLDDGWGVNKDGAETVDWIHAQPWCDGKIGTLGASAGANTQILLAPATSKVQCQIVESAACDFYLDLAYPGGVWRPEQTDVWFKMFGEKGAPARATLREHPTYDALWQGLNAEAKAPDVSAPAMHIGSWFDIFKEGTLRAFTSRQERGGEGAKGNQCLIMKWSGHGNFGEDMALKFPDNVSDVKVSQQRDRFMARWLKGEDVSDGIPVVQYYVIGDDTDLQAPGMEWRTASRWPPFPPHSKPLYLYGEELQEAPPERFVTRTYLYDPANPCPTVGGCNLTIPIGPYDQRELLERKDLLLFKGPVLDEPVEVTGAVRVKLFVSSDAPDTDFTAKLIDVYPSGDERHVLALESIQRVKFRGGFERPAPPLDRDVVVPIEIDLGNISWIFNAGHRIALLVSSSNYPHFEVNPNTGDDFPSEGKVQPANNSIHMGPKYPSALIAPVRLPDMDTDRDGVTDETEWDKGTDYRDANSK